MNLENIMLSKRNQTQKDKFYMIDLFEILRIGKTIVTESQLAGGGDEWKLCPDGYWIYLGVMKLFWI